MGQHVLHCLRKNRYVSETYARKVIARRRREGAGFLRSYWCPMCNGYHITKQPQALELLKPGSQAWAVCVSGVAWKGEVIEQTKGKGAVLVRWRCPAGELEHWFVKETGRPQHKAGRGWYVVGERPGGDGAPVAVEWEEE